MNPPLHKSAFLLLTALWLTTLTGITSTPLETHEAFVLETSQTMQSTGDWILPRFNKELRLQKPPLSYWLTGLVSRVDPFNTEVQIWHGRMVSLLAGLLIVLVTARTGALIYGQNTGLLAALLLLSSQGFIHLSHSARPDFLYAALCAVQLLAWIEAWKAEDRTQRQRWSSLLGWAAAALATLAKGPQVPAVFLAGTLIFLLAGHERKRTLRILRPLSGAALFCALVLPWWILLNRRLQSLGVDLADSQLSGSLLRNLASWKELSSGYYLGILFVLTLPASLAIPFMIPRLWKTRRRTGAATRFLLCASVTLLVVFTLGGHYRKHYLLPILPVFALLLARAVCIIPFAPLRPWQKTALAATGGLATLGCAGLLLYRGAYGSLLILSLCTAFLFLLLKKALQPFCRPPHPLAAQALKAAVLMTVLVAAYHAFIPSQNRIANQRFSEHIGRSLQPEDVLIEWKSSPSILPYYAQTGIIPFLDIEKLKAFIAEVEDSQTVFAVLDVTELDRFRTVFDVEVLLSTRKGSGDFTFVKINGLNPPAKSVQLQNPAADRVPAGLADIPLLIFSLTCPRILSGP
jgi:4-amino-4-deoxy-L-arabinose transferase-like glycosyltransferase